MIDPHRLHQKLQFAALWAALFISGSAPRDLTFGYSSPSAPVSRRDDRVALRQPPSLFDTGGEANPLVQNLEELGLDASVIDAIVLSHDHWDHVSGLPGVLSATAMEPKVYVPAPAAQEILQPNPQADPVAVTKPTRVLPGAWLVGPMQLGHEDETEAEYVLVLDQQDGLVVIVGCSHPDIIPVVEKAKEVFGYRKIKLIAGAVNLRKTPKREIREISLRLQQMGIKSLALSSCAGEPALKVFRQEWGHRVVSFDLGDAIDF